MIKFCRKIKERTGDSFVEVLCALLIISLSFAALCNAVLAAKKLNRIVRTVDVPFAYTSASAISSTAIKITIKDVSPAGITVTTGSATVQLTTVGPKGSTYRYYTYEVE